MSLPLDTFPSHVLPVLHAFLDVTPPRIVAAPPMLKSEVVPQVYNRGIVTEIPFVNESSEWELLSLLGNWYEPEFFESIFSSITSDAVC